MSLKSVDHIPEVFVGGCGDKLRVVLGSGTSVIGYFLSKQDSISVHSLVS